VLVKSNSELMFGSALRLSLRYEPSKSHTVFESRIAAVKLEICRHPFGNSQLHGLVDSDRIGQSHPVLPSAPSGLEPMVG